MNTQPNIEQELTNAESGLNLGEYWKVIQARKWLVISITALTTAVGGIYFSVQPNVYTSDVKIIVEKPQQLLKSSTDVVMPSYGAGEEYYGTRIAIMTGRKISGLVISELKSPRDYGLRASHLLNTSIINLSVTHRDPKVAAKVANKYAEIFIRESKGEGSFVAKQMLQWIPEDVEMLDDEKIKQLPGFDKKEFAESLLSVTNDPVIQKYKGEKLALKDKLNALSQRYKPQHPTVRAVNEQLDYINEQVKDRTKKILNNLRASLEGEMAITNVRVLEEALPPQKPSGPDRTKGILLSFLGGFGASVALVLLLEYAGQKIREEKDLKPSVNLPFLGYIPIIRELKKSKKDAKATVTTNLSLLDIWKQNSVLADSVAGIRTHLLFSMPYEKSKRIMLTSSMPDEGKTTVAALLAMSLAALGRKILLIDADMRKPFLHTHFQMTNEKGLTDYLIGAASISDIIRVVPGTDMKIITAGSQTLNPSELLASESFGTLLDKVSQDFDRLVIDVAPVLYIADGLILAKNVHSGILVCGSGMVHRNIVRNVKEKFDAIGHSFIGVIINKADYDRDSHRYKYFRAYHKHYAKPKKISNFGIKK